MSALCFCDQLNSFFFFFWTKREEGNIIILLVITQVLSLLCRPLPFIKTIVLFNRQSQQERPQLYTHILQTSNLFACLCSQTTDGNSPLGFAITELTSHPGGTGGFQTDSPNRGDLLLPLSHKTEAVLKKHFPHRCH